ncbi:hypothetical protein EWM64_g1909 [Hericium alpestre]|uniref:Uncharacterized protein n=1 Tax=Hericium alpestre TaxID=135208 RepID=A0A4Z0A6W8_9AGAM|nr:hypothetical protein EWM64_g1909 [Hericium alpestre]
MRRIFGIAFTSQDKKTFKQEMRDLWDNARTLPYVIRQICIIQFFAWLAWFPILFYTTLYIGDLYRRSLARSSDSDLTTRAPHETTAADAEATRLGARAQLYSALVSLATNFLAPLIVAETHRNGSRNSRGHASWQDGDEGRGWEEVDERWWRRWWQRIGRVHLATLWAASHAIFAACMFGTLFTNSVGGATALLTITGLSWGITQWAPFSLLAEAILTTPEPDDGDVDDAQSILLEDTRTPQREEEQYLVGPDEAEDEDDIEDESYNLKRRSGSVSLERDRSGDGALGNGGDIGAGAWDDVYPPGGSDSGDAEHGAVRGTARGAIMGNADAQRSWVDIAAGEDGGLTSGGSTTRRKRRGKKGLAAKAGIIIGIHNVFVVVPQFLVTGISSVIFALFEPDKSVLHGHHAGKMLPPLTNGTESPVDVIGNSTLLGNSTLSSAVASATVALLRARRTTRAAMI